MGYAPAFLICRNGFTHPTFNPKHLLIVVLIVLLALISATVFVDVV